MQNRNPRMCPKCGVDGFVIDTRIEGDIIRRRRKCENCGHRWTSVEIDKIEYIKLLRLRNRGL